MGELIIGVTMIRLGIHSVAGSVKKSLLQLNIPTDLKPKQLFSTTISKMAGTDESVVLKDGTTVGYVVEGTGDRTTLLLPGFLSTARTDFSPQIENLNSKEKLKLIAWDPPGCGSSKPPERTWPKSPNHFYSRDADVAMKFMNTIGEKKFSLLGWSGGAITSMIIAGRYPEQISKMVVYSGQSYFDKDYYAKIMRFRDLSMWSAHMREPMEKIHGKKKFPVILDGFGEAVKDIIENNKGDLCKTYLSKIDCPTLIIHGEKDPFVSIEHAEYLEKHIKNSRLYRFPDGAHNLHFRHEAEFNLLVEDFLLSDEK